MRNFFQTQKLITPFNTIHDGVIEIENGIFTYFRKNNFKKTEKQSFSKVTNKIIAPGFIDIHTHGGFGITFGCGDLSSSLTEYCQKIPATGVTSFLLTLTAPDCSAMLQLVNEYTALLEKPPRGARPLGLHLEGPFLNPEKKGAFRSDWLQKPNLSDLEKIISAGKGWVRQMTLAPELPGALEAARFLRWHGVIASLGHSNADYETAWNALETDFTHVTHTYNAQSPFNHRNPGVIGAVLTSQKVTAELIADGHHVHPAAAALLVNSLGTKRVVLVTDAIAGAGMPDGAYQLMNESIEVKNGIARLPDGTLAGSSAQMDQCVRNMIAFCGIRKRAAIRMATLNPAKAVGLTSTTGVIKHGRKADFVVLDENLSVLETYVSGELMYSKSGGAS